MLRLGVFDLAGTLFPARAPVVAIERTFRRAGVNVPLSIAAIVCPGGKRGHIRQVMQSPEVVSQWQAMYGSPPTESDADLVYTDYYLAEQRRVLEEPQFQKLLPGAMRMYQALRESKVAIAHTTGYPPEINEMVVGFMRKQGFHPDAHQSADRPNPAGIFRIMDALGVSAGETAKFGDTREDIEEGVNARCSLVTGISGESAFMDWCLIGGGTTRLAALPLADHHLATGPAKPDLVIRTLDVIPRLMREW